MSELQRMCEDSRATAPRTLSVPTPGVPADASGDAASTAPATRTGDAS